MTLIRFVPSAIYPLMNMATMLNLSIKGDAVINAILALLSQRVYVDNGKKVKENRNDQGEKMTYEGKCVGGPWNGKMLTHKKRSKLLFQAVREREAIVIGEYRLNNYGQWHWWPTEEGKAFDTLYGKSGRK
jgi:hypothetical protein